VVQVAMIDIRDYGHSMGKQKKESGELSADYDSERVGRPSL